MEEEKSERNEEVCPSCRDALARRSPESPPPGRSFSSPSPSEEGSAGRAPLRLSFSYLVRLRRRSGSMRETSRRPSPRRAKGDAEAVQRARRTDEMVATSRAVPVW